MPKCFYARSQMRAYPFCPHSGGEVITEPKLPPHRVVEIVNPSYQPSKADREEEFDVPAMTLEEAARRVLEPVEVRTIPRPRGRKTR